MRKILGSAVILLLIFSLAYAADVKISALPSATDLTGTETLPVVQGGATKKVTADQIVSYASTSLGLDALFAGKQDALGFTPENVASKSTATTLGTSDTLYPSQNAVKGYVDAQMATTLTATTASGTYVPFAIDGVIGWYSSWDQDFSDNHFKPMVISSSSGTCNNNELASFATATSGQRLYLCESGAWQPQGGTGGSMTWPGGDGFAIVSGGNSWGTTIKAGTFTDAKWCSYTTAGGLACTETAPLSLSSTTQNYFLAAPNGSNGTPTFRAIVAADIPTLNQNTSGTAANVSGTPALPNGTTATTQAAGDNSTKLATTAYVDTVSIPTVTSGNGLTITTPNTYLVSTGTNTHTLPTTAAGKQACFRQADAGTNAIEIKPPASSYVEASDGSAYCTVSHSIKSAGANGDAICYVAIDTTHWIVIGGAKGTWTCQ